MRKLASIETIKNIIPIQDADRIELVEVLGWQCVAKKGEFKEGDKCVYFEVDAYLPIEDRYEFLRSSSYRNNEYCGEGFRIRTQKFRGQISQGLALPIGNYPELANLPVGTDVSEKLNVRKWELPEMTSDVGTIIGDKPYNIQTTDETRVQSLDVLREELYGKPYYISTKMDGTSCTMYLIDGKFGVCTRNNELKNDGKSSMWKFAIEHDIEKKLRKYGKDIILQGEFCGHGIQKNRLKLMEAHWYVFNAMVPPHNKMFSLEEMQKLCGLLGIETVPIEESGNAFKYSAQELIERAKGKYSSGLDKEGIVIRPLGNDIWSKELNKILSFKVLNNDFLAKE